jgi:transketolase
MKNIFISENQSEYEKMLPSVVDTIFEFMKNNPKIVVATADLAASCGLDKIKNHFPNRFLNFGIAEQNMVSTSAGMAYEGMIPIIFTFGVFASLRAAEQVRTDIFYNDVPVLIVGSHSGLSTGQAGPTHFSIEDLAIFSSFSNSNIMIPSDSFSASNCIHDWLSSPRPSYLRLDRNPVPNIYKNQKLSPKIAKNNVIINGEKIVIFTCGVMTASTIKAVQLLARSNGITPTVVDIQVLKPIDRDFVESIIKNHDYVVTVEEHSTIGGLGATIAEIACSKNSIKMKRIGINDIFPAGGPVEEIRKRLGLDSETISNTILEFIQQHDC